MQTEQQQIERLVAALNASRIGHLRVPGDPWFDCPIAQREDSPYPEDYPTATCNCRADQHNAAIDAVLAAVPGEPPTGAELVPLLPDPPADLGET